MKIRNQSMLPQKVSGNKHKIDSNAPELRFMKFVCERQTEEALALFRPQKLFGGLPAVDAPYGRFEGLEEIREFVEGWLARFCAVRSFLTPVVQTRANGHSITEAVISFEVDGEINEVSMFIVSDLRTQTTLDEVRLYCHFTNVPGLTAYRKPIFQSAHLEAGDPGLLTGAVREYYAALHHMPAVEPERILRTMGEHCTFGGYEPYGAAQEKDSHENLQKAYAHMAEYIPRCVGMRYETITDDGVTCVIEWQHIVSDDGRRERSRVAISGIAAYERGEDGLLCSVRICDYAGYEKTIDWEQTPISKEEAFAINAVKVFPSAVGCIPL